MLNKTFYYKIILRIVLILITCTVIIPLSNINEKLFSIIGVIILIIIQVYSLIKYMNRFNTEIANFLTALKANDTSFTFHKNQFKYITDNVKENIEHVRKQIHNTNESIEIQNSYFKSIIENAQTGILVFNKKGKVDVINKSALGLLGIKQIQNITSLNNTQKEVYKTFQNIVPGQEKLTVVKKQNKIIPLSVRASEFIQKQEKYKLISFQNIQTELEENELESWQKLTRVLTHEINNTISPITSLALSTQKLFYNKNNKLISKEGLDNETIIKTSEGLEIISKRGEGLIEFVNNYKNITSLKLLKLEVFKVAELFYNLEILFKKELNSKNIKFKIQVIPIDLELNADRKHIEQIVINLIKNAIEAINDKSGFIELKAYINESEKITFEISDNGIGISQDIINQIYVPFFTTKEKGSGIGLSLARQIMRLHGGSISVQSEPGIKTTFTLFF